MAAIFLACAAPALAQPAPETLRIAISEAPGSLDPATDRSPAGFAVLANLCDTLVAVDAAGKLVPSLARDWAFSPDARTLTLTLRDDAGVDASAVKASLDRARQLAHSARRAELAAVVAIDIPDATHVRLHLDRPFVPLVAQLAGRAGMIVTAVPDDGGDATCAGPYRVASRDDDGSVVLARDETHWARAAFAFARVAFVPVGDPGVRLARLRGGGLDLVAEVAPDQVADLESDRRVRVVRATGSGYRAILFNLAPGRPGSDAHLRAALDRAIAGAATDPARGPFTLTLTVANEAGDLAVAEIVRRQAKEAGIDIRLRTLDPAVARQRVQNGDFEATLVDRPGRPDPDGELYAQFHCRGAQNDSGYCDRTVDDALDRARAAVDPDARRALYAAAMARLRIDLPAIFLDRRSLVFGLSARLADFAPAADGVPRVRDLKPRAAGP
ncbi:MAG: hypothetical protein HY059_15125 [Proteobacteria bacterium]|nr:hypothetical protein [Pseudomonadota bacterium]